MEYISRDATLLTGNMSSVVGNPLLFSENATLATSIRYCAFLNDIELDGVDRGIITDSADFRESWSTHNTISILGRQCDFVTPPEGWVFYDESSPIGEYLSGRSCSTVGVYLNVEIKSVFIVSKNRVNNALINSISSLLPRLMPWIFNEISEGTKTYLHLIDKREFDEAVALVRKSNAGKDFVRMALEKYRRNSVVKIESDLRSDIAELTKQIATLRVSIASYAKTMEEKKINLEKILLTDDSKDEIADFFLSRKNIRVFDIRKNEIHYTVVDTLEYYDEDLLESYISNQSSYFSDLSEKAKQTLRKIFLDGVGKFRVEASFVLSGLSALEAILTQRHLNEGFAPHPHLVGYKCLGGNGTEIELALENGNWQVAVDQTIAATKNIFFGDSIVGRYFVDWLINNSSEKVIEVTDTSRIISFDEAIEEFNREESDIVE